MVKLHKDSTEANKDMTEANLASIGAKTLTTRNRQI